ncbi:LOW QUALITY PROTEIN: hypothetical protein PHPALM_29726, partial [Phytophthora palmivora]
MKATEMDDEDQIGSKPRSRSGQGWSDEDLENWFYHKELREFLDRDPVTRILRLKQVRDPREPVSAPIKTANKLEAVKDLLRLLKGAGMTTGVFDAGDVFDLDLKVIQTATKDLFSKLKILVGEIPQIIDPVPSPPASITDRQTSSSHYPSAVEDESDLSSEPKRMPLGPSGAIQDPTSESAEIRPLKDDPGLRRPDHSSHNVRCLIRHLAEVFGAAMSRFLAEQRGPIIDDASSGTMQKYFEAAMSRFLAEQRETIMDQGAVKVRDPGSQDVDMESVRSEHSASRWEYDPDDIDFPMAARATVATATTGSAGSTMIQRVRISAISDLKEFTEKDQDEDRTRAWIGKVKSAFMRDQASDEEKCLTFADLLAGSAKNWYRQLSRSTRNKWSDLLRAFQIQYCGLGVSVARQYYHARRRPEESPLDYLYRLNVAGLRAKLKIKDGNAKDRCEHVDHYIETLEDQDLADRLTLLRLSDADDLEEVLRARERAKSRQKEAAFGSSKYRQKATNPAPAATTKHVRAVQIRTVESESESGSDGSDGSDSDGDNPAEQDVIPKAESGMEKVEQVPITHKSTGQTPPDHRSRIHSGGFDRNRCSRCGSKKHSDLGCWRRLTCHKCGKRGHPADHCLFVCRGKDGKLGRSPGWNPVRAERSRYCIYAFVNKKSVDQGSQIPDLRGNTYDLNGNRAVAISSVRQVDDYSRSEATMTVDLHPGDKGLLEATGSRSVVQAHRSKGYASDPEAKSDQGDPKIRNRAVAISSIRQGDDYSRSEVTMMVDLHPGEIRGYWKQQDPDLWFKPTDQEDTPVIQKPSQIKEIRRSEVMDLLPGESRGIGNTMPRENGSDKPRSPINNERGILLLDTGAEVSIVDTAFARKVGCYIDTSQIQDCVGIGESVYRIEGRTRIKITMAGSL